MIPFPLVSFSVHIVYIVHTVYPKKKLLLSWLLWVAMIQNGPKGAS